MSADTAQQVRERARSAARGAREAEAEALYRELLRLCGEDLEALSWLGSSAFRRDDFAGSVACYERCVRAAPQRADMHFNLGTARERLPDPAGAVGAYLAACHLAPGDARLALFAGAALEAAGRHGDAAMLFSLADGNDPRLVPGRADPRVHPEVRARCEIANRVIREHFTALHARAVAEVAEEARARGEPPPGLERVLQACWVQTHVAPVAFRTPLQRPGIFYVPGLPPLPVAPRSAFPWAAQLERATGAIRTEYLAAVAGGAALAPYVEADVQNPIWQPLRGRTDWSSLHLYKSAREQPVCRLFPRTLQALAAIDMFRVGGTTPMEVFFSRLAPGTHIPPHFGVSNHRLTLHLPLIVPEGCAIRVGEQQLEWHEGELLAFDDSFEHEAWNRGGRERVVLIFETHHPDLTAAERLAIERSYERRGQWLRERRVPEA